MTQLTLLNFFPAPSAPTVPPSKYPGGWTPPEHIRIPGVRFAPEVPREECENCPYNRYGHPGILDPKESNAETETYQNLCTKDCLRAGIPLKRDEQSGYFELKEGIND